MDKTVSVDKAAEIFVDMIVELCPELLGYCGIVKEIETISEIDWRNKLCLLE